MTVANPPLDPADDDDAVARLADLQALTDRALGDLDLDDLLLELLPRVREILDVDTAAVLTLDPQSDALVARAACGIEDEVRQGVRVPLGQGFAGRVAATRSPVVLDHVDATTVTNRILYERGIETMLGVPLLSGPEVIGVLHVGRLVRRAFTEREIELLQIVADRVAAAIQIRRLAINRAATNLLERSLLPARLPKCPGLQFATRFAAAEQQRIGGDWYDVFVVPSGQLWVVVGDVAGHGLNAAVAMGRIRSALRAYTMLDIEPERVLDLVDRKVRHFDLGTIATVVCGVLEPPFDSMRLAVAGHLPPVLTAPGRAAEAVETVVSPPIGTPWDTHRTSTTIEVPRGAVVSFYTDGLVERRGEVLDVGLERLQRAIWPGPPEEVARDIMRQLVGSTPPRDDIALVVMARE